MPPTSDRWWRYREGYCCPQGHPGSWPASQQGPKAPASFRLPSASDASAGQRHDLVGGHPSVGRTPQGAESILAPGSQPIYSTRLANACMIFGQFELYFGMREESQTNANLLR